MTNTTIGIPDDLAEAVRDRIALIASIDPADLEYELAAVAREREALQNARKQLAELDAQVAELQAACDAAKREQHELEQRAAQQRAERLEQGEAQFAGHHDVRRGVDPELADAAEAAADRTRRVGKRLSHARQQQSSSQSLGLASREQSLRIVTARLHERALHLAGQRQAWLDGIRAIDAEHDREDLTRYLTGEATLQELATTTVGRIRARLQTRQDARAARAQAQAEAALPDVPA